MRLCVRASVTKGLRRGLTGLFLVAGVHVATRTPAKIPSRHKSPNAPLHCRPVAKLSSNHSIQACSNASFAGNARSVTAGVRNRKRPR